MEAERLLVAGQLLEEPEGFAAVFPRGLDLASWGEWGLGQGWADVIHYLVLVQVAPLARLPSGRWIHNCWVSWLSPLGQARGPHLGLHNPPHRRARGWRRS